MMIIVYDNSQKIEFTVNEYACMLVLHTPKHHHHHFTWQQITICTVLLVYTNSSVAQNADKPQKKVHAVWARVSHKELRGNDGFHVIPKEVKGR